MVLPCDWWPLPVDTKSSRGAEQDYQRGKGGGGGGWNRRNSERHNGIWHNKSATICAMVF